MEYQSIFLLQNQYPSIANYDGLPNSDIILNGVYPQNYLEFTIPSIQDIEVVEDTSFRFILEVKETAISDEARYFTSPNFYADLESAKVENHPYFLQTGLDEGLFVKITLDKQIKLFNDLKLIDLGTGVKQNQNLFLLADNSVDYVTLVQYVDWLVGRVNPLDDDNNGVIPVEKISDFEIGKYDPETGEFVSIQEQAVAVQNRIAKLEEELEEVQASIDAMTGDLPQEPKKRKTGVLEIISLGLGAVSVVQGVGSAIKTFGKAASAAGKSAEIIKTASSIKPLPPINPPAPKVPDFAKLFPNYTPPSSVTSALSTTQKVSKTFGSVAKATVQGSKKVFNSVKNYAATAGKTTAKVVSSSAKFVVRQAGTKVGQAVIGAGVSAAASTASTTNIVDKAALKKTQTDIILKSVAKSAAVEVGKVVAKKLATNVLKGAASKLLGAAAGPIGAGIMAAVGIVKFFVGKAKEKKEFKKQKAEYDKVMGELERLTKRKEEIQSEINSLLKSAKLSFAREFDEKYSSTQKYFANIGKSILETQQSTTPSLAYAEQTITEPVRKPSRFGRGGPSLGG